MLKIISIIQRQRENWSLCDASILCRNERTDFMSIIRGIKQVKTGTKKDQKLVFIDLPDEELGT